MWARRNSSRCRRTKANRRRGVILLESALVYSVTLMLLLGTIVMGLGVFRYQQIASLAREGSRWAAVRGPTYQQEQSATVPTDAEVKTAILSKAIILDSTALSCDLNQSLLATGTSQVVVTYTWTPEAYFAAITMSSTSSVPVTY